MLFETFQSQSNFLKYWNVKETYRDFNQTMARYDYSVYGGPGSQTTCLLINFLKNNIAKKSSFLDKNFYYEILCTDCFFELFISLICPSKIMEGRHIAGKWMKYIREEHKFRLGKILRFMFSHCVFLCLFCFYRLKLWGNIAHRMSLKVLCVSGHSWSTLLGLK